MARQPRVLSDEELQDLVEKYLPLVRGRLHDDDSSVRTLEIIADAKCPSLIHVRSYGGNGDERAWDVTVAEGIQP
jgi:hypothetical protein